jgi:hypothetical protein
MGRRETEDSAFFSLFLSSSSSHRTPRHRVRAEFHKVRAFMGLSLRRHLCLEDQLGNPAGYSKGYNQKRA